MKLLRKGLLLLTVQRKNGPVVNYQLGLNRWLVFIDKNEGLSMGKIVILYFPIT